MQYLMALIYFVLALIGIDGPGSRTLAIHSIVNGSDVLYSSTRINAGVAEFTCIRSASGHCHYQLLPTDCAPPQVASKTTPGCMPDSVQGFVLVAGGHRDLAVPPARVTLCVGQNSDLASADCEMVSMLAPLAWRR